MSDHPAPPAGPPGPLPPVQPVAGRAAAGEDDQDLVEDVLVEEVSIDGMCGVY